MRLLRPFRFFIPAILSALLAGNHATSQFLWRPVPFRHPLPSKTVDTVPTSRWLFSVNPFGILEGPAAIGAGVGYRFNYRFELWAETSFLWNQIYNPDQAATGFRQVLQLKVFPHKPLNSFLAFEVRYKQFSFRDTGIFYNAALHDTLNNVPFEFKRHFFAAALQVGRRKNLSKDGKWQLELSIGFGIKYGVISRPGVPDGYTYDQRQLSGDLHVRDFWEVPGYTVYFPGSLRIIYTFGKRLY